MLEWQHSDQMDGALYCRVLCPMDLVVEILHDVALPVDPFLPDKKKMRRRRRRRKKNEQRKEIVTRVSLRGHT